MCESFVKKIENLELQHKLDDIEIVGVKIWDLYRYRLQNLNSSVPSSVEPVRYLRLIKSTLSSVLQFIFAQRNKNGFAFLRHPRVSPDTNGRSRDIYSDYIISDLSKEHKCIIFDPPSLINSTIFNRNTSNISTVGIYVIVGILFKLLIPFIYIRFYRITKVEAFYSNIKELLPTGWGRKKFNQDLFYTIYKFKLHRFIWNLIFKFFKPKYLVLTVSYGNEAVIDSARSSGIRVVELQHGSPVVGKLNYDYSSGVKKTYAPDIFMSFGSFMHRQLPVLPHKKVIPLGFPHFTKFRQAYGNELEHCGEKNKILVLSQPKVDREVNKWLIKNQNFLQKCIVEVRMHPYYDNTVESPFSDKAFKLTKAKEISLYEHLIQFDVVIGCFSTAMYEASAFGLDVYIIPGSHEALVKNLIDEGYATKLPREIGPKFIENKLRNLRDSEEIFKEYRYEAFLEILAL